MTHRAAVPPDVQRQRRRLCIVEWTAAGFAVPALLISGPALYIATETGQGGPSPTLVIPAPDGPQLPAERRSGGLASLEVTPGPQPPAVVYEPQPAPVVERVTPPPPPAVVYVEVPVRHVVPTPQHVTPELPEVDGPRADEPQRDEGEGERHRGRRERHKRDKTTTPGTETTVPEKPSQVCVIGICVDGQERDKPTADDASDAKDQSVTESDNSGRKNGGKNRS